MAGYGNRTAPEYTASSLEDDHSNTRLDLTDSHSVCSFSLPLPSHPSNDLITSPPSHPSISPPPPNTPQPPSYGAGFGNKRASQPSISPSTSAGSETGAEATRFNTQDTHGNAPYSNAHTYGSASTAGAGWGNKTGSFSSEGREEQHGE